jgi:acetyltransferase-like isoleucine patch superfamily enzyme
VKNRWRGVLSTVLDPMTYFQLVRVLHFYSYAHVRPRRRMTLGAGATVAPNVSLRNGERISVGARTQIGERAYLWAGDSTGRIIIGDHCRFGPEVFVTASDYGLLPDQPIAYQERNERDVLIGNDVWLGARAFIGAGVTIGDGCVVSAGSVVTKSLPPGAVAVGIPARIVRRREDYVLRAETGPQDDRATRASEPARPEVEGAA